MMRASTIRRILLFLGLTALLTAGAFWFTSTRRPSMLNAWLLMWSPGVAALLTSVITRRSLREFGWKWGPMPYEAAGYLIPMAYAWAGYSIVWLTGLGTMPNPRLIREITGVLHLQGLPDWVPVAAGYCVTMTLITAIGCGAALGEEIGWRGFLVPELAKITGFSATAWISGILWALWHYPGILLRGYHTTTPIPYQLVCFTTMIICMSFVMAWLRLRSGSLWPAVLLHASHNAVVQEFMDGMTVDTGPTAYFIGEFGCAMLPFLILIAFYFYRRRAAVEAPFESTMLPTGVELDPSEAAFPS